jgi:hypothetical protein
MTRTWNAGIHLAHVVSHLNPLDRCAVVFTFATMDDAQIDHELAQLLPDSPTEHRFRARRRGPYNLLLVNFIVLGLVVSLEIFSLLTSGRLNILLPWDLSKLNSKTRPGECNGYLPNLLATDPPRAHDPPITKASEQLDKYLSKRASEDGVDALYVAVVTSEGVLFEGGYGSARANETSRADRGIVDKDTIFRIASVSKLFTTLETLILRERGALNWWVCIIDVLPTSTNVGPTDVGTTPSPSISPTLKSTPPPGTPTSHTPAPTTLNHV